MKKIVLGLIAVSMIATPAMARHRDHYDNYGEHRHRGGGGWIAPLLGGIIIGAVVAGSNRDDRRGRDYDNRYYPPDSRYDERYCVREQVVEWRRGERYIFWQTTCN